MQVNSLSQCLNCGQPVQNALGLKAGICKACQEQQDRQVQRHKAKTAIAQLLERDDILILDTETTGMGQQAEVIELSVINTRGEVLLDSLVKPRTSYMNPFAQRVHGISMTMLEDAPSWPDIFPQLAALADRRTILAWNASFDASMLEQTSLIWELEQPKWLYVCAMRLYAKARGIKNRGLHKCVVDEGLSHLLEEYPSHRALGDIIFVLEVLRAMGAKTTA